MKTLVKRTWKNAVGQYNHDLQRQMDQGMVVSLTYLHNKNTTYAYVVMDSQRVYGGRLLLMAEVIQPLTELLDSGTLEGDNESPLIVAYASEERIAETFESYESPTLPHYLFISDEDNGKTDFTTIFSRFPEKYRNRHNVHVSLHSRKRRNEIEHVRQAKWLNSHRVTEPGHLQGQTFWHATTRKDWAKSARSAHDGRLMVHVGSHDAAKSRAYNITDDDFIMYKVRLNSSARVMPEFVNDVGTGWFHTHSDIQHHEWNTFAYVNEVEDTNSVSLYVQATALEVVKVVPTRGIRYKLDKMPCLLNTKRATQVPDAGMVHV